MMKFNLNNTKTTATYPITTGTAGTSDPFFWTTVPPIQDLEDYITVRLPVVCPVCQGRQTVQEGFYDQTFFRDSTTANVVPRKEVCRTCTGLGVIWKD